LLNHLAKRKVAIVSDIPGTTRDILNVNYLDMISTKASLNLGGFPVIVSDTAGLRDTQEVIESEGVKLAM
jgi:tRNA modification GTPase